MLPILGFRVVNHFVPTMKDIQVVEETYLVHVFNIILMFNIFSIYIKDDYLFILRIMFR